MGTSPASAERWTLPGGSSVARTTLAALHAGTPLASEEASATAVGRLPRSLVRLTHTASTSNGGALVSAGARHRKHCQRLQGKPWLGNRGAGKARPPKDLVIKLRPLHRLGIEDESANSSSSSAREIDESVACATRTRHMCSGERYWRRRGQRVPKSLRSVPGRSGSGGSFRYCIRAVGR